MKKFCLIGVLLISMVGCSKASSTDKDIRNEKAFITLGFEDGFWINSEGKNISISDMPTRYLKNCLRTLNNSNSWNEVTSLKNFMDGKITADNKSVFVEYLGALIESKMKEVETELERR